MPSAIQHGVISLVVSCFVRYLAYILSVAGLLVVVRFTCRVPREPFRKMLHAAAFSSAPVVMWLSHAKGGGCLVAVLVLVAFGALVWPALVLAERIPWYADLLVERHPHEVRRSLLLLFWGDALIVAVCWGLFGRSQVAVASILMWGFGDAAAALVGKRWGRHHTGLPLADPAKTWEGTGAMLATSSVVGLVCRAAMGGPASGLALPAVLLAALVGAYVELVTRHGYDTVTVPIAHMLVLLALGLLG